MNNEFTPNTDKTIDNDTVISTLNGLIETCRDGQQGFKEAAEGVGRADLKTVFYEYSQQRATFVGDLQALVQTLGGDPENTGSIAGAVHRGWINLKAAITGKDDTAILDEAERGEDVAKSEYKKALETKLPSHIQTTVQAQYAEVQKAHDKVKALRDAAKDNVKTNTASVRFN